MRKGTPLFVFSILFLFLGSNPGFCLKSKDIIRLKNAKLSDETIELIMREKVVETCAFTLEGILALKNAGLSDKTIQMLIREHSFMKESEPIFYGKDLRSIRFTTASDLIELKNAGLSEETLQAIIIFSARDVNDVEREKAREMLSNMGIVFDLRDSND
jgi:hypothetical protein